MVAALAKAAPSLTVTILLDALRQTLEFEAAMSAKFGQPVSFEISNYKYWSPYLARVSFNLLFNLPPCATTSPFRQCSMRIWEYSSMRKTSTSFDV